MLIRSDILFYNNLLGFLNIHMSFALSCPSWRLKEESRFVFTASVVNDNSNDPTWCWSFTFYFFSYKSILPIILTRSGNTMSLGRQEIIYIFLKNFNRSFFDCNGTFHSFWNTNRWISTRLSCIKTQINRGPKSLNTYIYCSLQDQYQPGLLLWWFHWFN